MTKVQQNTGLIAAVLLGLLLSVLSLSSLLTNPWHAIPAVDGDAAKNTLTYLYHSLYGSGYHYEGMNYPYGEHIVYTDGIPLLSVFFAGIGNVSAGTVLAALWWLISAGYVLAVVYIYKTLVRHKVATLLALFFAGAIGVMTPQLLRITGHFGLSVFCLIPMLHYWTLAYYQERRIQYAVYVFVLGLITVFIHPYNVGLILIWVGLYVLGYGVAVRQSFVSLLRHAFPLVIAAVAPPAVMMLIMKATDGIGDRPVTPFSSEEAFTTSNRILSSSFSPFWELLTDWNVVDNVASGGEGFTYIGLVPILVVCITVFAFVFRKIKRIAPLSHNIDRERSLWLVVALGALVIGAGIPFRWGMMWLKDYTFVFKQFRTMGRFTWIFYHVTTVYVVLVIMTWYKSLYEAGKRNVAICLLALIVGVWSVEAYGYIRLSRQITSSSTAKYDRIFQASGSGWGDMLDMHGWSRNQFQAIILLKFFHVGTDKIWVGNTEEIISIGTGAALQLQLPIVDVMMARSSWSIAQQQVKIAGGPYTEKQILKDIGSNKPFLLIDYNTDSLAPDERYLLSASEYIGEFQECSVYACYPERIAANDKRAIDSVRKLLPYMVAADTCVGDSSFCHIEHLDKGTSPDRLWGGGAATAIKGKDSCIATISLPAEAAAKLYEFSCWFLLARDNPRSAPIWLNFMDSGGKVLESLEVRGFESKDSYVMWFRANRYFYIPKACTELKCVLRNDPIPSYIAMDELVLRPANTLVVSKKGDSVLMVNNHRVKLNNGN